MDRDGLADLLDAVDRRAPGLVRFLAGLRWGGLRTVRPGAPTWTAVAVGGAAAGFGVREGLRRATGRAILPAPVAVAAGPVAAYLSLWRWDTLRWRRTRVRLVLDLPTAELGDLVEHLRTGGLDVEGWERRDRVGGPVVGLVCRSRDLRRVNGAVDEALRSGLHRP